MNDKMTKLVQLRMEAERSKALLAQVAAAVADAIEEMDQKKQDAASAVTMEQVNAAIDARLEELLQTLAPNS